jgi:hypothetical protein
MEEIEVFSISKIIFYRDLGIRTHERMDKRLGHYSFGCELGEIGFLSISSTLRKISSVNVTDLPRSRSRDLSAHPGHS